MLCVHKKTYLLAEQPMVYYIVAISMMKASKIMIVAPHLLVHCSRKVAQMAAGNVSLIDVPEAVCFCMESTCIMAGLAGCLLVSFGRNVAIRWLKVGACLVRVWAAHHAMALVAGGRVPVSPCHRDAKVGHHMATQALQ